MTTNLRGGQPESFQVQAAATAPIAGNPQKSWLDHQHPEYARLYPRWKMTEDFYFGELADREVRREYLVRRFQGEPDKAYDERVLVADFTPHLGTLVDTLAGMLFAVEDRKNMTWSTKGAENGKEGLGDPKDAGSPAARLVRDADGQGTGWKTLWREFALDLIVYKKVWVLVDTVDGVPVVKLVRPTAVPNWLPGKSGPVAVLMKEDVDVRASLEDDPRGPEQFILWKPAGWERWRKAKEGTPELVDQGAYAYEDREGRPALPIFPVELPMRRYITWLLAHKASVLFNQESVRDFGLRISAFAKLLLKVADKKQFKELKDDLGLGSNVLPVDANANGAHEYIAPPAEPIASASDVLKQKIEDFWLSGFQMYADSAAQKTATEVKQDVASGVGAFLQLLAAAVDDGENGALWRLEQAEYAGRPDDWGVASVERSDDFSTVDLGAVLDMMRKRYLGEQGTLPVGRSALVQLAKEAAQQDGLPVDDAEIQAAVDAHLTMQLIDGLEKLGVTPALVKARLAMKLVSATGLIDAKETIKMSDKDERNLLEVMMEQAEELANVQEQTARREAELPPFGGAGAPPGGGGPPKGFPG